MNELTITAAGLDYLDRARPLIDGRVSPAGIALRYIPLGPTELFRRVVQYHEFEVAEMSFSTYLNLISRGDRSYVAIPVFPGRNFRHGFIFVHCDSGIREPKDLIGRRAGVPEYQMTAALWQRALLTHDYGVHPQQIQWFEGPFAQPGYLERNPIPNPAGVSIERIPADKCLDDMIGACELDVLFGASFPSALHDGSGRVRRLFPNFVEVEQEYFRRTGFFPIMHLVVIRRDVYERDRWIAVSLLNAYTQARDVGWQITPQMTTPVMLPWLPRDLEELSQIMPAPRWPYGFRRNYEIMEAMCQYSHEQGLSTRRLMPEELFAPETHDVPIDLPAGPTPS